uniref:Metalloendopeptidase n=1 Tax=Rhabditophanes sp. KR3021 TaxID=114890 RepID=A0AC35TJM0_9BILA
MFLLLVVTIFINNSYCSFIDLSEERQIWPNGQIPYSLASDFSTEFVTNFLEAIDELQKHSCVTFKPKVEEDNLFLNIKKGDGCWSFIGLQSEMIDRGQTLSLNEDCKSKGAIMHYLMHSLGFFHEHTRYDRDHFITVMDDNIQPDKLNFYNKREIEEVDKLGPYDYFSIMHFDVKAYAVAEDRRSFKINMPGIDVKVIGQRTHLSMGDIHKLTSHYKCNGIPKRVAESKAVKPIISPMRKWSKQISLKSRENQCDQPEDSACDDLLERCPFMAKEGDCEKKPGVMLRLCAKSCCNCKKQKCFDTLDTQKFNTLCNSYLTIDNTKKSLCDMEHTRQNAIDYCPLHCGACAK